MRRDFVVTRVVLGVAVLSLALAMVLGADRSEPSATLASQAGRPDGPSWSDELRAPEIRSLWLERRRLLDDLSRRYREATDDARRESLRREMERLIEISERDVYDLRLRNARRDGHEALAAWLERARSRLPEAEPAPGDASTQSRGETHDRP